MGARAAAILATGIAAGAIIFGLLLGSGLYTTQVHRTSHGNSYTVMTNKLGTKPMSSFVVVECPKPVDSKLWSRASPLATLSSS